METTSFPILDFVPVGFRFRPTDEELVNHYLKNKLLGNDSILHNVIAEVDVCKFEPWDLPACSAIKSDDPEWFFLCARDYKYAKSKRLNRRTKCGFWKATGNDRNIKVRGTNKVIGTKKTLVFYKGCVPGVKTNWVIHEYHAVTFEDSQRNFVLCRLMKKAEKNGEDETDTMICDEGEPSRPLSSDYENQETVEGISDVDGTLQEMNMESIFQAPHQADRYFPFSTQQSSIFENEQEVSFQNYRFPDAYFGNENIVVQSPFETIEEENKFIKSMFIDGEFVTSERRRHAFVNGPTESESLRRVYYQSIDSDVEVVSTPFGDNPDTSTAYLEYRSSIEYNASNVFQSMHDVLHGSTCLVSSNNSNSQSTFQDDFLGVEASSCDSTADKPSEFNCNENEISSSPSTL